MYNMSTNNQHNQQNSRINMQPMTISQTVQVIQDYQAPQLSSTVYPFQPQENVFMEEYSFYYKVYNDFQIYHIICKQISFELISRLLSNHDCLAQNHVQSNDLHVFYYQQPDDKKIYQVMCEIVSYNSIIYMLNKIKYGIELSLNLQENSDFSREYKENLEFHLRQDLNDYLAPIDTSQQPINYPQGHIDTNV